MGTGKKILLIQLFSNGDCLYATAIARQIKHDFPGCHLTWAIAGFCKNILIGNPYVDEVMEVNSVPKSDIVALRKLKKEFRRQKEKGIYDEVFCTVNMDENQMYYDGCIRTNILHAYPGKITEGIQPVLRPTSEERQKVEQWVKDKELSTYRNVILFEFAPQSGQLKINSEIALAIAQKVVTENPGTAIILSSANAIHSNNPAIIDGSILTYRETVYLSNFCTMLLGCSSGITWGTTSDGGKLLPMVQILNPWTTWVNPISRDFERQGLPVDMVIELMDIDQTTITNCIRHTITNGFASARAEYNQEVPLHFKTTRRIVYNMLCYGQFDAIKKHIDINMKIYGPHPGLFKQVALAIVGFPVKLVYNKVTKNLIMR